MRGMTSLQLTIDREADDVPLRPHRAASLADEVYEAIFRQLMALKIAPGARISVDGLARAFDVSQTPIREALSRLEAEGLVRKTHLIGYSAAPQMSEEGLDEIYELRLRLEPAAAKAAAVRMDADALARLRQLADGMATRQSGDERIRYATFARQDAVFHDTILEIAGNALIRGILQHQHTHFHIFRLMFHSRVTEEALDEHARLMEAFEAGDGDAAEAAMRVHIERSRERIHLAFA